MMKKKTFFLFLLSILVVTILSLTACLKKEVQTNHPTSEKTQGFESSNREKDQEQLEKNRVQLEEATVAMDYEKCEKISDENLKRSCKDTILLEKAKNMMDETLCDQTSTEEIRAVCLQRVEESKSQKTE